MTLPIGKGNLSSVGAMRTQLSVLVTYTLVLGF